MSDVEKADEPAARGANGWNEKIINEFRANEGRVGGPFLNAPLLLLHTTGARTGQRESQPDDVPHRKWAGSSCSPPKPVPTSIQTGSTIWWHIPG